MNDSSEDPRALREDVPLAREIEPPYPSNPRPGSRTIVAMVGEYGRWKLSRVGLTLDDAIEEEMADYRLGLRGVKEDQADAYAVSEPDVGLWEGGRCLAVIRPRVGGEPEVTRFDGFDDCMPLPSTEALAPTPADFLPWDLTDKAIARWAEAKREAEDAYRAAGEEKWTNLATAHATQAERQLIAAILAWGPGFHGIGTIWPAFHRWPARGVISAGKLYLTFPHPDREGEKGDDEYQMMILAEVELSAIVDLADAPDTPAAGP